MRVNLLTILFLVGIALAYAQAVNSEPSLADRALFRIVRQVNGPSRPIRPRPQPPRPIIITNPTDVADENDSNPISDIISTIIDVVSGFISTIITIVTLPVSIPIDLVGFILRNVFSFLLWLFSSLFG